MTGRGLGPGPVPPAPQRLHFAEAAELLSQASCSIVGLDGRGRQAVETAWPGPERKWGLCQLCVAGHGGAGGGAAPVRQVGALRQLPQRECTLSDSGLGPTSDVVLFRDWAPGPWS